MPGLQGNESPIINKILTALPPKEYTRLSSHLEHVPLTLSDVLYYPQDPITHVYFPNRGTVSVISTFEDGGGVEVGVVGNEGMFGINIVLGSVTTPHQALVQLPGEGFRVPANLIQGRIYEGRPTTGFIAPLHAGLHHPDRADGGLQSFAPDSGQAGALVTDV